MITKGIEVPVANSQRFVELNRSMSGKYHFVHFDADWFQNSLLPHQKRNEFRNNNNPVYKQLLQSDQTVCIQIHVPDYAASVVLQIRKCDGTITTISGTYIKIATKDGNVFDNHGAIDPVQLVTYQWIFTPSQIIGAATGLYHFLITADWGDGSSTVLISEPNDIQAVHLNTLLFEYTNSRNDFGIFFDMSPRFSTRLEGWLSKLQPKSERTTYRDEMTNLRQLNSRSYRIFDLVTGGKNGISEYHIDKMRAMFDCDVTFIDGKQFVLQEESEFTITEFKNYPLKTCITQVCEYWPEDAATFYSGTMVNFYELSEATTNYPYVISRLSLGRIIPGPFGGSAYVGLDLIPDGIKEIFNQAEEIAFISDLNSTIVPLIGVGGVFGSISGFLTYRNAIGENYTVYASDVYKDVLTGTMSPAGSGTFKASIKGYAGTETIVSVWTDAMTPVEYIAPQRYISYPSAEFVSKSLVAGDYKYYMYTNNKMKQLQFVDSSNIELLSLSGKVSSLLQAFSMGYFDIASLNVDFLLPAKDTLVSLDIQNSTMASIDLGIFTDVVPASPFPWYSLSYLSFALNELDDTAQDYIYNSYFNYVGIYIPTVGTIATLGQTPSSSPTAASATARAALTAKGWTIVT